MPRAEAESQGDAQGRGSRLTPLQALGPGAPAGKRWTSEGLSTPGPSIRSQTRRPGAGGALTDEVYHRRREGDRAEQRAQRAADRGDHAAYLMAMAQVEAARKRRAE